MFVLKKENLIEPLIKISENHLFSHLKSYQFYKIRILKHSKLEILSLAITFCKNIFQKELHTFYYTIEYSKIKCKNNRNKIHIRKIPSNYAFFFKLTPFSANENDLFFRYDSVGNFNPFFINKRNSENHLEIEESSFEISILIITKLESQTISLSLIPIANIFFLKPEIKKNIYRRFQASNILYFQDCPPWILYNLKDFWFYDDFSQLNQSVND